MLFPALMAFAASSDLLTMTISNRVSLILVGGFFVLVAMSGMAAGDVLMHVGTAGAVLVAAFGCFARGWIGGADAKLAAATALWLGFDHLLPYLVYASLFGGALTLLLIQFRTVPLPGLLARWSWLHVAPQGRRRPLWHRAGRGRAGGLSADAVDGLNRAAKIPAHHCDRRLGVACRVVTTTDR